MTSDQLTISHAQKHQPWTVPYADGVIESSKHSVKHILASHTVLHASKSVGKLAEVFERLDHGEDYNNEQVEIVKSMSADLMTAALRFANLYGFDLARVLAERVEEKNGVNILDIPG